MDLAPESDEDGAMELVLESDDEGAMGLDVQSERGEDVSIELAPDSEEEASMPSLLLESSSDEESVDLDGQGDHGLPPLSEFAADSDEEGGDLDGRPPAEVCFQWAFRLIAALKFIVGTDALRCRLAMVQCLSSHFSGLGTVEVALQFLAAAVLQELWLRLPWSVELLCDHGPSQQKVLLARQRGRCCVFDDMLDRVPTLRPFAEQRDGSVDYAALQRAARAAPVVRTGKCVAHGRPPQFAQCAAADADVDVSGSPCKPWSAAGSRRRHQAAAVAVTLAWCAWLLGSGVKLAIHENVTESALANLE